MRCGDLFFLQEKEERERERRKRKKKVERMNAVS